MTVFRFRNFRIYQDSKEIAKEIILLTRKFPREFWFLKDQINRSSLSMPLNIAEGSAKRSDRDFNRYLENSLGSINETMASLEFALDLKLISSDKFKDLETKLMNIANQTGGFSRKLLKG